jgi:hypothetical protein
MKSSKVIKKRNISEHWHIQLECQNPLEIHDRRKNTVVGLLEGKRITDCERFIEEWKTHARANGERA